MSTAVRLGHLLFRFRSLTPLPVLVLIAWLLYRSRGHPSPYETPWMVAGCVTAALGQALRFYTLGQVQDGTSGQDDVLEAKTLNTRGPYAHVRNPLYLGNLFICSGLLLAAQDALAALVGLTFFFVEYFFIIRAEEAFLTAQFGERYGQYLRDVPRWVPRFNPAYGGPLRNGAFDWRRALKKEHNPFTAWTLGLLALVAWERLARGAAFQSLWPLVALAAAILVFFAAVKTWKRGWLR